MKEKRMKIESMGVKIKPAATSPVLSTLPADGLVGHIQAAALRTKALPQESKMKKRIKVLLVDDHPVVRKGIASCLSQHDHLEIIGECADGREALKRARELIPDVILMDIDMPHMNGLAVTDLLRKEQPKIKVLILSMHSNTDYILRIIQSGARGYVLKDAGTEELLKAIEAINQGEAFFSPEVARAALNQYVKGSGTVSSQVTQLTNREREVLVHIADGLSNKEIASQLGVGVRTVETHRERIMRKLNIHSVAGLTKFAISQGLVSLQ
ncbi:MAG TPA: response regulator transcription factor [Verrucomicrobiae bacterium]